MNGRLIFFLVIVVFSIIQSIIKSANEKAKKQQLQADPDRRKRVQNEIESFLAEVSGGQPDASERRRKRQQRTNARRREQQIQKNRREEELRQQKKAAAAKLRKSRSRKVGSGITEHVDEYIHQHVNEYLDHDVDEYVEATIVDNVDLNLGDRTLEMLGTTSVARPSGETAKTLVSLLRDPNGVRNAILVYEILTRPAVLKRR